MSKAHQSKPIMYQISTSSRHELLISASIDAVVKTILMECIIDGTSYFGMQILDRVRYKPVAVFK